MQRSITRSRVETSVDYCKAGFDLSCNLEIVSCCSWRWRILIRSSRLDIFSLVYRPFPNTWACTLQRTRLIWKVGGGREILHEANTSFPLHILILWPWVAMCWYFLDCLMGHFQTPTALVRRRPVVSPSTWSKIAVQPHFAMVKNLAVKI